LAPNSMKMLKYWIVYGTIIMKITISENVFQRGKWITLTRLSNKVFEWAFKINQNIFDKSISSPKRLPTSLVLSIFNLYDQINMDWVFMAFRKSGTWLSRNVFCLYSESLCSSWEVCQMEGGCWLV
jgi:hypothetical protein